MRILHKYGKVILFDTLAGICFIGVVLFGWLPGPGGLPLLLLGLSLLGVNHAWAKRWLETVKYKGKSLKKYLFPKDGRVQIFYDIGSLIIIIGGFLIIDRAEKRFVEALGAILITFALMIFLFNRDRFDALASRIKRKKT